jgi:DNA-directed RNA polymerase subunit RPC12/RpoP
MLASKCIKCGKYFVGWSLDLPENQRCRYCGSRLLIHDDTIPHYVDYGSILKSLDRKPDEWQRLLEQTLAVYFRDGLPNATSTN